MQGPSPAHRRQPDRLDRAANIGSAEAFIRMQMMNLRTIVDDGVYAFDKCSIRSIGKSEFLL